MLGNDDSGKRIFDGLQQGSQFSHPKGIWGKFLSGDVENECRFHSLIVVILFYQVNESSSSQLDLRELDYNSPMSEILRKKTFPKDRKFEIARGDITLEPLDAIVNAANAYLQHGGGVAWAIARRGGEAIQRESDEWVKQYGPVAHEKPAYTSGGLLMCKYVIHVVGPVWGAGDEDRKLAAAARGALECAAGLGLSSLALPAISTGIFGFPKEHAAQIVFAEIERFLGQEADFSLKLVRLVLFDAPTVEAFLNVWDATSLPEDSNTKQA